MASFTVTTIKEDSQYKATPLLLSCLYFFADFDEKDGPGAQMASVFNALASRYGSAITFYKIEAESAPSVSDKFGVSVVPTFVCLQGNEVVGRLEGVNPPELTKMVKSLSELPVPKATAQNKNNDSIKEQGPVLTKALEHRLKAMLAACPSLLFMKGSPEAPRCGFSRKIVDALKSNQVPFASFDILTDEHVRQGLKELSDWPTYPQFYVKGELVGGLDIINDMIQGGDLKQQLGLENITEIPSPEPIEVKLQRLINLAPITIFIKGSPAEPKCGFSKTLLDIFDAEKIEYKHFDILTDQEVRAELKTYSDWPTYPQVYVNGEFMGGLDIIKDMLQQGPLSCQFGL